MPSIELFAGAGGLALGVSRAGFLHHAVVEWDSYAFETLLENKVNGLEDMAGWNLIPGDVRSVDYAYFADKIDLVCGGPPCQPFSLGGRHRGHLDKRDMFPTSAEVVREVRPKALLFENVPGLLRKSFKDYIDYVCLRFGFPEVQGNADEEWPDHLKRLRDYEKSGKRDGLWYDVRRYRLNAANYGVPQKRERVFIVGFRGDLGMQWSPPTETHSKLALAWSQREDGEYWGRHRVRRKERIIPGKSAKMTDREIASAKETVPWQTVRDAICDLPQPTEAGSREFLNHVLIPGARSYAGHTGSPIDEPAKTLKAGVHGVPGGENMVRFADESIRYFTVRESARLQCFPDEFRFHGCWGEVMRQLGNAVPVQLAEVVARSVAERLRHVSTPSNE